MARVVGVLKFRGSLDDLTFIETPNGIFVKKKPKKYKDKIMNSPKSQGTRENMQELENYSKGGKLLKEGFIEAYEEVKIGRSHNRVMSTAAAIKNLDKIHPKGWKSIATGIMTEEGKSKLSGFDFNHLAPLGKLLGKKYLLDKTAGILEIKSLIPFSELQSPEEANKAGFQLFCSKLDFETGTSNTTSSEEARIALDNTPHDISLNLSSLPEGTGINVFVLKLIYYQEINGQHYMLYNQEYRSAKIIAVE